MKYSSHFVAFRGKQETQFYIKTYTKICSIYISEQCNRLTGERVKVKKSAMKTLNILFVIK